MITYPVAEKFVSINGEGPKAGELSVFIRFQGCNLNCSYCDTQWVNQKDTVSKKMTTEEIFEYIQNTGVKNVTLTGGEPLLQKDISLLIQKLIDNQNSVEIETNGSINIKTLAEKENRPVFTLDYKLPSSNMEKYMLTENYEYLTQKDTIKFVIGSQGDLERAMQIIQKYHLLALCHVYFSPVFQKIQASEIVDFMIKKNLNGVRLQLQLHKYIWDPQTRGV